MSRHNEIFLKLWNHWKSRFGLCLPIWIWGKSENCSRALHEGNNKGNNQNQVRRSGGKWAYHKHMQTKKHKERDFFHWLSWMTTWNLNDNSVFIKDDDLIPKRPFCSWKEERHFFFSISPSQYSPLLRPEWCSWKSSATKRHNFRWYRRLPWEGVRGRLSKCLMVPEGVDGDWILDHKWISFHTHFMQINK